MSFRQQIIEEQINWARNHLPVLGRGTWDNQEREHILLRDDWEHNLWRGIRSGSEHSLPRYLKDNGISKHRDHNHLNSSWINCANLYFPFRSDATWRQILTGFFESRLHEINSVESLELEYEPDGVLRQDELLGEIDGGRGVGQTSPDVALQFTTGEGHDGLALFESKYCESNFESCSGRKTKETSGRPGNPDTTRCEDTKSLLANPISQCHLVSWGRKYWDHLLPVVQHGAVEALPCCPAAHAGYQLFRQQAMAEGIAAKSGYSSVVTGVAYDARNTALRRCLRQTGINDFTSGWASLFNGKATFHAITHQSWVEWVRNSGGKLCEDWLDYISRRYGY